MAWCWWRLQWKSDDKWCWLPATQARAGNICRNISPNPSEQILKSQKHCSFNERTRSALILWKMDFGDFPFSIITNLHIKYLNFLIVWKCRLQKFIFGFFPDYFRFICPCCSKFQFSPGSLSKVIFYSQWRSLCLSASEALFSLSDPHKRNGNHSSRDGKWPFRGKKAGGVGDCGLCSKAFSEQHHDCMFMDPSCRAVYRKLRRLPFALGFFVVDGLALRLSHFVFCATLNCAIFGLDRSSRSHDVCVSVRSAQSCLEHSFFLFLAHIFNFLGWLQDVL